MSAARLQVLIPESPSIVAGLPPSVRSAHRAAEEFPGARIMFCGQAEGFPHRFRRQLATISAVSVGSEPAADIFEPTAPLLVLSGAGFPEPSALTAFVARARTAGRPAHWVCEGRAAAAYYPAASVALAAGEPATALARRALAEAPSVEAPGWTSAADSSQAARAEAALFASLPKETDGYIARLDRRLSIAISATLLRLPLTPNAITTASLLLGLLGAWWLASGAYGRTLAGAGLLWLCCLLDGCDGEVARLKLLCSPSGAAYDLWADHAAHLATFVAIPLGVHRAHPQVGFRLPGLLLVSGFLACMFSVWFLVLSKPETERGRHALLIERVASRDYVYLILALAAIGRLDWFLYAAGVGSHVFWAALWLIA